MVRRAAGARRSAMTTGEPEVAIRSGRKRRSSNMRPSACALRSISPWFDATFGIFRKSNSSSRISFSCCSRQARTRLTASSGADKPSVLTTAAIRNKHLTFMLVVSVSRGSFVAEVLHLKLLHVAVVLLQRPGKFVGAVVPAHKIQEIAIGGVQDRFERGAAWRGNRARRQPGVAIGVVRRIDGEIVAAQIAVVAAGFLQG